MKDTETLRKAISLMKEGLAVFNEYCTEECGECPLYKANICGYDLDIDVSADMDDRLLGEFVEYHEKVQDAKDRQTFYEVTGIDASWYDFNEDRKGDR